MKRATIVLASITSFLALLYGINSKGPQSTVESWPAKQASSIDFESNDSDDVSLRYSDTNDESATSDPVPSISTYVDQDTDHKLLKAEVTREVPERYALLLEYLALSPSENAALVSFLVEDRMASTRTRYSSGKGLDEHERMKRLADILSEAKLQKFLEMERNIHEYVEVQNVKAMLGQRDVPLTDARRHKLLNVFVDTRNQLDATMPVDVERRTIGHLEFVLTQIDEYERLVMEQAPSALSPRQVQYLFERYQRMSYDRAAALERQRIARADPASEDRLLTFPARK